ncbi:helix-turn-helix transcriptional regulator [Streptomyces sp. NPDC046931]|uniref:helix-turn-helix domain-containing protein n=1 Tax=Streptomyces sp. NPDC046931 TaxID=3154806 RepID=UPI0033F19598
MKRLSARRRQVLRMVANGYTNAQIGRELDIHPRTVDRHLAETYAVLGARDRANAVAIALVAGLLEAGDVGMPGPLAVSVASLEPVDARLAASEPARAARVTGGATRRSGAAA